MARRPGQRLGLRRRGLGRPAAVEGHREIALLVGERRVEQLLALRADVGPGGLQHAGRVVDVDVTGVGEGPQAIVTGAADPFGVDGRRHGLGRDDVADAEERVVARVGVIEEVLGVGHERCGPQRVAHLVDVLVLEVLEDRYRPHQELVAPIGRGAGVDTAPRVGLDVVEQRIDLRLLLHVGIGLEADVRGVVRVVGVERRPGRRQHDHQPDDAQPRQHAAPSGLARPAAPLLRQQAGDAVEDQPAQEHDADARQQDPRQLHSHLEAANEHVATAGHDVIERAPRRAPEGHEQRRHPNGDQGAPDHVRAPAPDADPDAHRHEDRDHRHTPVVVELSTEEPAEDLTGPVAVLEPGPLENLVARRVVRLRQQRDDDPGRRQQGAPPDDGRTSEPTPQLGGDEERPHHERYQRQVPGLVVERHGQHDEDDGREDEAQRREGAVGETPGERERPGGPQLRPHAVADPDVGLRLVADAGGRSQEGGHGGGRRRGPAAEPEESAAPVDGQGPERQEQVHGPAEDGVGVDHRPDQARGHRRQALVVQVLGRSEPEIGEPAGQRQVPVLDPVGGEADHLLVNGAVVQVRHGAQFGPEFPQSPRQGDGDEEPRAEPRPGRRRRRRRRGRRLRRIFGLGRCLGRGHEAAAGPQGGRHGTMMPGRGAVEGSAPAVCSTRSLVVEVPDARHATHAGTVPRGAWTRNHPGL